MKTVKVIGIIFAILVAMAIIGYFAYKENLKRKLKLHIDKGIAFFTPKLTIAKKYLDAEESGDNEKMNELLELYGEESIQSWLGHYERTNIKVLKGEFPDIHSSMLAYLYWEALEKGLMTSQEYERQRIALKG